MLISGAAPALRAAGGPAAQALGFRRRSAASRGCRGPRRSRAGSSARRGSSASRRRAALLASAPSWSWVTRSRQELPTGSISHVTRDSPAAATSGAHSARKLCTSRRGGSTSRFSPSAISTTPGTPERYSLAGRPVGLGLHAEAVPRALCGIGDRLPQPLGRRLDVDLEQVHRPVAVDDDVLAYSWSLVLQLALELGQRRRERRREFAHPAVVDEPDRDGVQVVAASRGPGARRAPGWRPRGRAGASSRRSATSRSGPRARRASVRPARTARRAVPGGSDRPSP